MHNLLEHDHDTPSDCPLLGAHQPTPFGGRGQLRNVDWDLGRLDADSETIDNTADDKHANILRGANKDGSNYPKERKDKQLLDSCAI